MRVGWGEGGFFKRLGCVFIQRVISLFVSWGPNQFKLRCMVRRLLVMVSRMWCEWLMCVKGAVALNSRHTQLHCSNVCQGRSVLQHCSSQHVLLIMCLYGGVLCRWVLTRSPSLS